MRTIARNDLRLLALVLLAACCWPAGPAVAQDGGGVAEYHLTVDPDSFAFIYEHPHEDHYISAALTYEGRTWTDVRLRLRGDGSRSYPKKSLKLKFDGAPFANEREKLNFNADYNDKSYLNTVLSSYLMRASGQPAFEAEYARLYLNGSFLGLYVRVENMGAPFLEARGFDADGNLYKATRDNASMSLHDDVDLLWEKKTNEDGDFDDLEALIAAINTVPDDEYATFARSTFDYDLMVNILAMNMLVANGSTYYHNYYLFHDTEDSSRWIMMPWDLDMTLFMYGAGYPYHRSSGNLNPDNPFLERALLAPTVFADVRDRVDELASTLFTLDLLEAKIDSLATVLEPSVAEDTTDDVPDLATWRDHVDRVKHFIRQRPDALRDQFERAPQPFRVAPRPEITSDSMRLYWQPAADLHGDAVTYTVLFGTDADFSEPSTTVWTDLADTSLTLSRPERGTYYWKVTATDGNYAIDGYDTYNPLLVASPDTLPVVISEINYNSADDFDPEDWVELYNPNDRVVDLSGWRFMDEEELHAFTLPEGAQIGPRGYLILCRETEAFRSFFPDVENVYGDWGFGLSGGGEHVRLFNALGTLVDSLTYDDEAPWPTEADGDGPTLELRDSSDDNDLPENWTASRMRGGTPGDTNSVTAGSTEDATPPAELLAQNHPNPFTRSTRITYRLEKAGHVRLDVYDVTGRLVQTLVDVHQPVATYDVVWRPASLGGGVYAYRLLVDGALVRSRRAVLVR